MLTVISSYSARRARKSLREMVERVLGDGPALLVIVSDQYTNEDHLRPFAPLAERFGDQLHVIVAAEWPAEAREREGQALLRWLEVAPEQRGKLLRDEGELRVGLVVREKKPVALLELFFKERGYARLDGSDDPGQDALRVREASIGDALHGLLGKLPPPAPPPSRPLQPGEHDFSPQGLCRLCGQGQSTLSICPGTKADDGPRRDRFELIELD